MWSKLATSVIAIAALTVVSAGPGQDVTATPSVAPMSSRVVRFTFVPPPLEGTISVGIYDRTGKLVRVLHQEAELDEFTVEADGLATQWDGKDDDGIDLPSGKYHARGYSVARPKIDELPPATAGWPPDAAERVTIKLVRNSLAKNAPAQVELAVACDDENCFLKTSDGLPLVTISDRTNLWRLALAKRADASIDVLQDDGDTIDQLRVSNVNQMMAFDCGEIELK